MVYKGPEQDPLYIAYWNKFPDPFDVEGETPTWLVHFECHHSENTAISEDAENQVEDDKPQESFNEEEEEGLVLERYTSSARQTEERIPPVELDYSQYTHTHSCTYHHYVVPVPYNNTHCVRVPLYLLLCEHAVRSCCSKLRLLWSC